MTPHLLMIDDEVELAQATTEYLTLCGVPSVYATDAEAARRSMADRSPDLILLDVNLPGTSGFELCQTLRQDSQVPIMFMSARDSDSDQILALSLGGDDYVRKPVSMAVLLAKVRRMLERACSTPPAASRTGYQDDWLTVDLHASRVWVDGDELRIPATEFRLLSHLVENQGRIISKQDLLDQLWSGSFVSEGTLSVHIRRLRTRIEPEPDNPVYVRTAWGRGYLFERAGS